MGKKFWLSVLAAFVVSMLADFAGHGMLLKPDYTALGALYRSDADSANYFPYMLLAHLLAAFGMAWIYARGVEAKPWLAQGLRFGAAVALLATIPGYLIYYAVQPLPGMLVAKQIVFSALGTLLTALAVAAVNRRA
jgi:hypothetical protein